MPPVTINKLRYGFPSQFFMAHKLRPKPCKVLNSIPPLSSILYTLSFPLLSFVLNKKVFRQSSNFFERNNCFWYTNFRFSRHILTKMQLSEIQRTLFLLQSSVPKSTPK